MSLWPVCSFDTRKCLRMEVFVLIEPKPPHQQMVKDSKSFPILILSKEGKSVPVHFRTDLELFAFSSTYGGSAALSQMDGSKVSDTPPSPDKKQHVCTFLSLRQVWPSLINITAVFHASLLLIFCPIHSRKQWQCGVAMYDLWLYFKNDF